MSNNVTDKVRKAKQEKPELFMRWYNAAFHEISAARHEADASYETFVSLYAARSEAERLYKELFDD